MRPRALSPLCVRQQLTEQYGERQVGHLYFALVAPQTMQCAAAHICVA